MRASGNELLRVDDLSVTFATRTGGTVTVVNDVSFSISRGETLALVGESGSGKTVTCMSVVRLLHGAHLKGRVSFVGEDLTAMPERALRALRGRRIAMVFQDSQSALDPIMTVGDQIIEVLRYQLDLSRRASWTRAVTLLEAVGLTDPQRRMRQYPHELSGGMRQRVMIAIALSCDPALIIADEPTTALDVTIQAQILGLFAAMKQRLGAACLLITHDLGVVAQVADTVAVMYAGRIVERAPVLALFDKPSHPYTLGLLACMPAHQQAGQGRTMPAIPGTVPDPASLGSGCAFRERCPNAFARCAETPPTIDIAGGHSVQCWLHAV